MVYSGIYLKRFSKIIFHNSYFKCTYKSHSLPNVTVIDIMLQIQKIRLGKYFCKESVHPSKKLESGRFDYIVKDALSIKSIEWHLYPAIVIHNNI